MSRDKGRKEAASASACYFHTSFHEYLIHRVKNGMNKNKGEKCL